MQTEELVKSHHCTLADQLTIHSKRQPALPPDFKANRMRPTWPLHTPAPAPRCCRLVTANAGKGFGKPPPRQPPAKVRLPRLFGTLQAAACGHCRWVASKRGDAMLPPERMCATGSRNGDGSMLRVWHVVDHRSVRAVACMSTLAEKKCPSGGSSNSSRMRRNSSSSSSPPTRPGSHSSRPPRSARWQTASGATLPSDPQAWRENCTADSLAKSAIAYRDYFIGLVHAIEKS